MGSVPPLRVTVMVVNTPFSTSHGLGVFDNVSGVRIVRFSDWLAVAPAMIRERHVDSERARDRRRAAD